MLADAECSNAHRSKTGALLTASVVAGGMYAGADDAQVQSLRGVGPVPSGTSKSRQKGKHGHQGYVR